MDMVDTKKCFRGVLLWREDVIKCAKCVKKPLSEYVRDLLHTAMVEHRLSAEDNKMLRMQIEAAFEARKRKHPNAGKRMNKGRVLTVDTITIPAKVRKHPKFVKG